MDLEQQVVSLELSKKLKELGVKRESYFMWVGDSIWNPTDQSDYETRDTEPRKDWVSAFTVAELGEMLPDRVKNPGEFLFWKAKNEWVYNLGAKVWIDKNEANARAKMIIYLIEIKLLKKNKWNLYKQIY